MTKVNSANVPLTGSTGTVNFVGSDSPTLTGNIDAGGATTFEIPNSAAPTLNAAGQIALDTTITGHTPLIKYYDGSTTLTAIAMPTANLSTVDNSIVSYNATNDEFEMITASGGGATLIQFVVATLGSDFTTTSATAVSTGLSASITPGNASNIIVVEVYGAGNADKTGGGSRVQRWANFNIQRTAPSSSTLSSWSAGLEIPTASGSALPAFYPIVMAFSEVAGSTSAHTYRLDTYVPDTAVTSTVQGTAEVCFMFLYEFSV